MLYLNYIFLFHSIECRERPKALRFLIHSRTTTVYHFVFHSCLERLISDSNTEAKIFNLK